MACWRNLWDELIGGGRLHARRGDLREQCDGRRGRDHQHQPRPGLEPPAGTAIARVVSLGTSGLVAAFAFDENSPSTRRTRPSWRATAPSARRCTCPASSAWRCRSTASTLGDGHRRDQQPARPDDRDDARSLGQPGADERLGDHAHEGARRRRRRAAGVRALRARRRGRYQRPGARPASYLRANPVASTTDRRVAASTGVLPLNTWTHLASTYDGANFRFYVNGVLVGTTATAPSTGPNGASASAATRRPPASVLRSSTRCASTTARSRRRRSRCTCNCPIIQPRLELLRLLKAVPIARDRDRALRADQPARFPHSGGQT